MQEGSNTMYWTFTRINPETGSHEIEVVDPVQWMWEAEYQDGTILKQYADDRAFHQFKEIDQTKLLAFHMVNKDTKERKTIIIPTHAKLIHFYRNTRLQVGRADERFFRCFVYGYELPHYRLYCVQMPDGQLFITDDVDKIVIS